MKQMIPAQFECSERARMIKAQRVSDPESQVVVRLCRVLDTMHTGGVCDSGPVSVTRDQQEGLGRTCSTFLLNGGLRQQAWACGVVRERTANESVRCSGSCKGQPGIAPARGKRVMAQPEGQHKSMVKSDKKLQQATASYGQAKSTKSFARKKSSVS